MPYIQADVFSPDCMPAHILEPSYRQLNTSLTTHAWLSTEQVGTGPFKYQEFNLGAWVTLTAFERIGPGGFGERRPVTHLVVPAPAYLRHNPQRGPIEPPR